MVIATSLGDNVRFFFLLALTFGLSLAHAQTPSSTTVGFIPGEDPEWLKQNGIKLAYVLQDKLGIPVNIYISKITQV